MTVRLPLGISSILSMRAEVPMRYMSSGPGLSTSLSRWSTAPSTEEPFSASRISFIDFSRPTVMGVMAPGNITELRRVSMGSVSGITTSEAVSSSSPVTMGIT